MLVLKLLVVNIRIKGIYQAMKKTQAVKEILKKQDITSWFQPIVNVHTSEVLGWEAFTRGPQNSPCEDTPSLFNSAAEAGVLKPFDLLCLHNAALCFEQLQLKAKLFVKLTNEIIIASSGKLKEQVGALILNNEIPPSKMVLELDLGSANNNIDELVVAANFLQSQGFEIALHGLNSSMISQSLWSALTPDYIKIDRNIIKNVNGSIKKQDSAREILAITRSVGAVVVAEGVETKAELETLTSLGIFNIQGYLIQRPELSPATPNIKSLKSHTHNNSMPQNNSLACDLVVSKEMINADTLIQDVLQIFEEKVFLSALAVSENTKVIGMVHRAPFLAKLSTRQRRDVLITRPISSEMDRDYLEVDAHLRLEQVSRLVTAKARIQAEHDYIITSQGNFLGIGTAMDLLRRITQLHADPDRHANLLTMLPGNIPIGNCVNELLSNNREFTIILLDLTNFKPFNNHYSHSKGDELLVIFADLLRKHTHGDNNFVGHIGGDDFIVVMRNEHWQKSLSDLFTEFNRKAISFYNVADQKQGGLQSTDHFGDDQFFKFVTPSAGAITITDEYFDSFQSLLTTIIQLKQRTKRHQNLRMAHQYNNTIEIHAFVEDQFEIVITESINTN